MYVQSGEFLKHHGETPNEKIVIFGQEKTEETSKICKMNLAVHGLEGEIKTANTMETDAHKSIRKMDFVMANPPFNVSGVNKSIIEKDKRFSLGMPKVDNANYLWIQCFYSALSEKGRAGFVMPNSASDARQSEQAIREKLIKKGVVDIMVSVGANMFHNVTLPCTLWFLDKGKKGTDREDKILFLDVKNIFTIVDRSHNEFSPAQIELIANITKLYRGEEPTFEYCTKAEFKELFPKLEYKNIKGLCKVATIEEVEKQSYSLNAGRYVGVEDVVEEEYIFADKLKELNDELNALNKEAHDLEGKINANIELLLGDL